jgi:L-lactate dehydrogenase complex protein LldG
MERAAFLDRIRRRLELDAPTLGTHPPEPYDGIAEPDYRYDFSDLVALFEERASESGAVVRRVTAERIGELIAEVAAAEECKTAVLSGDPETDLIGPLPAGTGVDVMPFTGPTAASEADLGVTGAVLGLAVPGSIVVDAGRAGGRTASLLPPVHLALVRATRILPHPAAMWHHMNEHFPDGLPSQLVTITGPSKTGDIELVLTTGVHGPKRLWIGVLED